jgi:hypothetical protein
MSSKFTPKSGYQSPYTFNVGVVIVSSVLYAGLCQHENTEMKHSTFPLKGIMDDVICIYAFVIWKVTESGDTRPPVLPNMGTIS